MNHNILIKLKNNACNIIIFGIKSDLSKKKLIKSFYNLESNGLLHKNTKILGIGRASWNRKEYILFIKNILKISIKKELDKKLWNKFQTRLNFFNLDFNNIKEYKNLHKIISEQKIINICYLAISPLKIRLILHGIEKASLSKKIERLVLEKPLGMNLRSFNKISFKIFKHFNKDQIYRIDHYLGKESLLKLIALKFSNSQFLTNWNSNTVDHIQITLSEEIGINNRWEYFNAIGQTRDMVQSHLLQILTIIAVPNFVEITNDRFKIEKIKILRSLRPINSRNINQVVARGQYTSNVINGIKIPGYLEEKNSDINSNTETFVSIKVNIDNHIWKGVPFYLRTGKRLTRKCSKIVIFFKNSNIHPFYKNFYELPKNKLTITLYPIFNINIKILNGIPTLSNKFIFKEVNLNFLDTTTNYEKFNIGSYTRLILELMQGRNNLFVHHQEIEESWKWIDPIISSWKHNKKTLETYPAGTWGPQSSENLINRDKKSWDN